MIKKMYIVSLAVLTPQNAEIELEATSRKEAFDKAVEMYEGGYETRRHFDFVDVEDSDPQLDFSDEYDDEDIPHGAYVHAKDEL